ncbi:MAG: hypothetical protein L0154_13440 [Chloroflexi bacterium]|nr:hypothetical protein [Chloroflexota bacterium]
MMTGSLSQCPCCGKNCGSLSGLMAHMKAQHTEAEILQITSNEKKEFATVA